MARKRIRCKYIKVKGTKSSKSPKKIVRICRHTKNNIVNGQRIGYNPPGILSPDEDIDSKRKKRD